MVQLVFFFLLINFAARINSFPQHLNAHHLGHLGHLDHLRHSLVHGHHHQRNYHVPDKEKHDIGIGVPGNMLYILCADCGGGRKK